MQDQAVVQEVPTLWVEERQLERGGSGPQEVMYVLRVA
jgi:hypothetical protein